MKNKRIFVIIASSVFFVMTLLFVQYKIIEVSARTVILPVVVEQRGLDFGTVFPGEELEGTFTIQYVKDDELDSVTYKIILEEKPLPPEHPDYPGVYKDLCEHLRAISVEGEGDEKDSASIGVEDSEDVWTIYFKVPAIMGNVSQDHEGGVVTTSGEYGCDISIDVLE